MPGVIIHLIAGCALFVVGRYSFNSYFKNNHTKQLQLLGVCLIFSILPDFFLGIYYLSHLEPFHVLLRYQEFTHLLITPLAIGVLIYLALFDAKRRPLWLTGALALVVHIVMDLLIMETTWLI